MDIVDNPKNLEFIEIGDGRAVVQALPDVDIIEQSGANMAIAGYDTSKAISFLLVMKSIRI